MNPSLPQPEMYLSNILSGVACALPENDTLITGLHLNSKDVEPGDLFLAIPGECNDGRKFIDAAIIGGCAAIAYESDNANEIFDVKSILSVPLIAIDGLADMLGKIASNYYKNPSSQLKIVGITGTNGKTTCSHLIAHALTELGHVCGVIGTLGNGIFGSLDESENTTPDAINLHRLLRQFVDQGATFAAVEASSHGIDQGRLNKVQFSSAVFTNLSRDHLDYHGSMLEYGNVKSRLFESELLTCAILNVDTQFSKKIKNKISSKVKVIGYSMLESNDHVSEYGAISTIVTGSIIGRSKRGITIRVHVNTQELDITSRLIGDVNAYNILAALATLYGFGFPLSKIADALTSASCVSGRMETFGGTEGMPLVVVDYAHTPDALGNACHSLKSYVQGQLTCVFGCGGDRDKGKRSEMGRVAQSWCQKIILTDDNSRSEDGDLIIKDILLGMDDSGKTKIIRDRKNAITDAIKSSAGGDVVLIAGKGHEDYQIVGAEKHYFSDRGLVKQLMGGMNDTCHIS